MDGRRVGRHWEVDRAWVESYRDTQKGAHGVYTTLESHRGYV